VPVLYHGSTRTNLSATVRKIHVTTPSASLTPDEDWVLLLRSGLFGDVDDLNAGGRAWFYRRPFAQPGLADGAFYWIDSVLPHNRDGRIVFPDDTYAGLNNAHIADLGLEPVAAGETLSVLASVRGLSGTVLLKLRSSASADFTSPTLRATRSVTTDGMVFVEVAGPLSDRYWRLEAAVNGSTELVAAIARSDRSRCYELQVLTSTGPIVPGDPLVLTLVSPADDATDSQPVTLAWSSSGGSFVPIFDVRFGTSDPPPDVVSGTTLTTHAPDVEAETEYFWQIVAHDGEATETSAVRSFTVEEGDPVILTRDYTVREVVNQGDPGGVDIYTFTIPAGTLGVDRGLRVTVSGDYLNNTGSAQAFFASIMFDESAIAGFVCSDSYGTSALVPSNAVRRPLLLEGFIQAKGATDAQQVFGRGMLGEPFGTSYAPEFQDFVETRDVAKDSTTDLVLAVNFTHSVADPNLSARCLTVLVEKL
jgi:hypothetical protein